MKNLTPRQLEVLNEIEQSFIANNEKLAKKTISNSFIDQIFYDADSLRLEIEDFYNDIQDNYNTLLNKSRIDLINAHYFLVKAFENYNIRVVLEKDRIKLYIADKKYSSLELYRCHSHKFTPNGGNMFFYQNNVPTRNIYDRGTTIVEKIYFNIKLQRGPIIEKILIEDLEECPNFERAIKNMFENNSHLITKK
jgi:hypothetical protein